MLPLVAGPAEARALGKPLLVLAAGVHGDEPTLRESVLIVARELATPGTPLSEALDRVTGDHPVVLRRIDDHTAVANGSAVRILREAWRVRAPEGALLIRDLFRPATPERALALVEQHAGEADAEQRALFRASLHAALTPEEQLMRRFALQLLRDKKLDDETFAAAQKLLGTRGVTDLTLTCSYYTAINMAQVALKPEMEAGKVSTL